MFRHRMNGAIERAQRMLEEIVREETAAGVWALVEVVAEVGLIIDAGLSGIVEAIRDAGECQ